MRQLVLLGREWVIDEAAVAQMIAGAEIAVDAPALSMLSVADGGLQSEGGIEPLWITEKAIEVGNRSLRRQH